MKNLLFIILIGSTMACSQKPKETTPTDTTNRLSLSEINKIIGEDSTKLNLREFKSLKVRFRDVGSIPLDLAIQSIKRLHCLIGANQISANELVQASYAVDLKYIKAILDKYQAEGVNLENAKIRFYPAVSVDDELTFVVALQHDKRMVIDRTALPQNPQTELIDYIGPCPPFQNCPEEDILTCAEWEKLYQARKLPYTCTVQ